MMRNRIISSIILLAAILTSTAQTPAEWKPLEMDVNFYVANDLGRNGYYDQKPIAELMGRMAETIDVECVAAPGDVHHFNGVRSTSDPLWMTNYELVYSHPELMLDWLPVLGNHEYRGNTQAVLDYAGVSARWVMPARYYTRVLKGGETTVRIVMLDTTPMIDKYRQSTKKYPDAGRQDYTRQIAWTDSVLTVASEDWVIVMGHHPIYGDTDKDIEERTDLQKRLDPIIRKHHNVSMYVCGHIHNFQHMRAEGSDVDYVVNTSASLSRPNVKKTNGTRYCYGGTGFSLVCADKKNLRLHLIDKNGKAIYTVSRSK